MGRAALLGLPGTPGQIHDFSPPITPSGLFWTTQTPDSSVLVDPEQATGSWQMKDLAVPDSINLQNNLAGGPTRPATVSFDVQWSAGPNLRRGKTRDTENHFTIEFVEGGRANDLLDGPDRGDELHLRRR